VGRLVCVLFHHFHSATPSLIYHYHFKMYVNIVTMFALGEILLWCNCVIVVRK
jgi:hypothetical protein